MRSLKEVRKTHLALRLIHQPLSRPLRLIRHTLCLALCSSCVTPREDVVRKTGRGYGDTGDDVGG